MSDSENTYDLGANELEAASVAGMTPREYAEMKGVRTHGDFEALLEKRKGEGRPMTGWGEPARGRA
jgi:hypothetical protein